MCLTAPARVLSVTGLTAVVELDGRRRAASLLLMQEIRPGDWVVVGAGTALRRLEAAEALDLIDTLAAARRAAATDPPAVVPSR